MPRIVVTEGAAHGLEHCRRFLAQKSPEAAQRAAQAIVRHIGFLETHPAIGRPLADDPDLRELVVPFGDSGYVVLYRHDAEMDEVYLLAFRHQRESGY